VTSLAELGMGANLEALDKALRTAFERRIGLTGVAAARVSAAADPSPA
jgi:hypothetical protein